MAREPGAPAGLAASARRTQGQRRAQTRQRLLDATIDSLVEVGYAATTTRAVSARAGVSTGAQTHHFPHRMDLIAAAVEYLADQRQAALHRAAQRIPKAGDRRIAAGLDLIWRDFTSPLFVVMAKLWVAAADDPDLYGCLVPVERRLARAIRAVTREMMGPAAAAPDFDDRMAVALSTIRGLALMERFRPTAPGASRSAWPGHRAALVTLIAGD